MSGLSPRNWGRSRRKFSGENAPVFCFSPRRRGEKSRSHNKAVILSEGGLPPALSRKGNPSRRISVCAFHFSRGCSSTIVSSVRLQVPILKTFEFGQP